MLMLKCLISDVWTVMTCNVTVDTCLLESHSCRLAGREPQDGDGGGGGVQQEQQEETELEGHKPHP